MTRTTTHGVRTSAPCLLWTLAAALALGGCAPSDADAPAEGAPPAVETAMERVEEAVWSADGSRLAVTWTAGGRTHLTGLFGPHDGVPPEPGRGLPLAEAPAGWATWSPDGLWVAYAAGREGSRDIVRARPDGTGPERLTDGAGDDYDPDYSPDGRRIVFVSTRSGGTPKLHAMDADGGNLRLLADLGGAVRRPLHAPDGRRLAVELEEGGVPTVYTVWADGSGWGRLGTGSFPAWFQEGRAVVYTENDSLFWRPMEGGLRRFLAADARVGRTSPDGRWMSFVRGDTLSASLWLVDVERGVETRITPD